MSTPPPSDQTPPHPPSDSLPPPVPAPPPLPPPEPPVLPIQNATSPAPAGPIELPPPNQPRRVPLLLLVATILAGLSVAALSLTVAKRNLADPVSPVGYVIGIVIGATVFWPAVIIGLFSIARRFRNPRSRVTILLVVWGVIGLSQINPLLNPRRLPPPRGERNLAQDAPAPADWAAPGVHDLKFTWTPSEPELPRAQEPKVARIVPAEEFDFSPGSDERLTQSIEHAQEDRYHRIVTGYEAACASRPNDPVLALERVRFIERFAEAEDLTIKSAGADLEKARAYLEAKFSDAPGSLLYQLERTYGPAFEAKAAGFVRRVSGWSPTHAAKFYLLRAQRENLKAKPEGVLTYADNSFRYRPTPEAGILLAQALFATGEKSRAHDILRHPAFNSASDWIKKQRSDLLFDLGETTEAISAFEDLKRSAPGLIRTKETAVRLARAGRVAEGRALLPAPGPAGGPSTWQARQRFEFELEFGDQPQAQQAYRDLRAAGFQVDPLARNRFELLRRQPLARWTPADLLGGLLFGAVLLAAALLPLAILGPIHHWSLWRERLNRASAWAISPWGLRAAWTVLGFACVVEVIAIWYFHPEVVRGWFGERSFAPTTSEQGILPAQTFAWVLMGLLTLAMLWREQAWRLVGPGKWSLGRAVGIGFGLALALRVVVTLYIWFVPAARPVLAQVSPMTVELIKSLSAAIGAFGTVMVVGLFVPVLEEVLFRGVVLGAFAKHIPFYAANALQSLGFALLHENRWLAPFFFGFAFLAGVLVRRSGGLFAAISMHATNNTLACLAFLALRTRAGVS